jgi:hypothetical protein
MQGNIHLFHLIDILDVQSLVCLMQIEDYGVWGHLGVGIHQVQILEPILLSDVFVIRQVDTYWDI